MKLRLEKRKDVYYAIIDNRKNGGKREYRSTGCSKKFEAEKVLQQIAQEFKQKNYTRASEVYFENFMLEWLKTYVKNNCRQNTYESYELVFTVHIKPFFEGKKITLEDVSPVILQRYYNTKLNEGLSGNTLRKHHANIRKCLDYAMKMLLIKNNPADNVELPKKKAYEASYYNREQCLKLLSIIRGTTIETPVALALGLGLRRGEICGLRWSDIDFQRGEMFVRNNKVQFRTEIEHDPKTKLSKRKLSLPKYLIDYLTKLPVISKYICILENQPMKPNYISRAFKAILKKNNLPHIRFHDLRHSFISLLMESGCDMKKIQIIAGHSHISTTMDIYGHLEDGFKKDVANTTHTLLSENT